MANDVFGSTQERQDAPPPVVPDVNDTTTRADPNRFPIAFVPDTGDVLAHDGKEWVHAHIAYDPKTRSKLYFDGIEWKDVPLTEGEKSQGRALSVAGGVTAGFGDEAIAAIGHPASAARAAVGAEPQTGPYYRELNSARDVQARYERENPGTSLALTAAGALPTVLATGGAGELKNAGTLWQGIKASAKAGAKWGAVAGFGSGEGGIENRLEGAATGAVTGATLGAGLHLLSPLVQPIYRMVKSAGLKFAQNPFWDATANRLTPNGERIAKEAGLDPAQASAELQKAFAQEATMAADPAHAAAYAESQTLPVKVPLTRGQVSGDPAQQLRENRALQGSRGGPIAQTTMQNAKDATRNALFGNLDAMQQRIAGAGGQVIERGQGGAAAQTTLSARARALEGQVDSAYDAARQGGDAFVARAPYAQGVADIQTALNRDFHPENIPMVTRTVSRLFNNADAADGKPQQLVSNIFQVRRELAALQRQGGVESAAATTAKRELDKWVANLGPSDLTGDPASIARWNDAIAGRRELHNRFGDGLISELTERKPNGELVVDPVDATNRILGVGDQSQVSRTGLVRNLKAIRDELGPDSQEWSGLRQEIFLRLSRYAQGGQTNVATEFSAPKFIKAWNDFKTKNPSLVNLMFSQSDRATMEQFVNVARRTIPAEGGRQLGSGAALTQAMGEWFGKMFPALARVASFAGDLPAVRQVLEAPGAAAASSFVRRPVAPAHLTSGASTALVPAVTGDVAPQVVPPSTQNRLLPTTNAAGTSALSVGMVVNGYRYGGGDPKDQRNWQPVH